MVNRELSQKAWLSVYWSLFVSTLTYSHKLWVVTKRLRLQAHATEMHFLHMVAGFSLRNRARFSVSRERLGTESLFLHTDRTQLRWFGYF